MWSTFHGRQRKGGFRPAHPPRLHVFKLRLCGKATIEAVHQHCAGEKAGARGAATTAEDRERTPRAAGDICQTGGLHAAVVFTAQGKLVVLREDVACTTPWTK